MTYNGHLTVGVTADPALVSQQAADGSLLGVWFQCNRQSLVEAKLMPLPLPFYSLQTWSAGSSLKSWRRWRLAAILCPTIASRWAVACCREVVLLPQ